MPNLSHPYRQNPEQALEAIEVMEKSHERMSNGFYGPPTLLEVFNRNAGVVVGGILIGSALLWLAAFLRGAL